MEHYAEIERLASDNFGYFTASAARGVGILSCELDRWVKRGRIESHARGVYRVTNYPPSAVESYIAALMSVGDSSYIYGESVLALLNLVPTNPERIYVASPRRIRRKISSALCVVHGRKGERVMNYDGVFAQHLVGAIRDARGIVRHDRRVRAAMEGFRQGYLTKGEHDALLRELRDEAAA